MYGLYKDQSTAGKCRFIIDIFCDQYYNLPNVPCKRALHLAPLHSGQCAIIFISLESLGEGNLCIWTLISKNLSPYKVSEFCGNFRCHVCSVCRQPLHRSETCESSAATETDIHVCPCPYSLGTICLEFKDHSIYLLNSFLIGFTWSSKPACDEAYVYSVICS